MKHHITNNNHTTDHVAKHPSPVYSNIGVNNVNNVYTDINTTATINSTNINTPRTVHPRPALMFSAPQESYFHSPHLSYHHHESHFSSFDVYSSRHLHMSGRTQGRGEPRCNVHATYQYLAAPTRRNPPSSFGAGAVCSAHTELEQIGTVVRGAHTRQ